MDNWSIPTSQLAAPRRLGGRVSKRGFAFQDAYACAQLTRLLDSIQNLIAVRPEGTQDVDLLYADGREEYVQIKHEPDEHYTLVALRSILQGFAVDLWEADRPTTLTFVLVARSSHIDAAVTRLRDGEPSVTDITQIATLLAQSTQGSPAPRQLVALSEEKRYSLAQQLVKQTKFRFGMGDEEGDRLSFESHAYTELAKHGVAGSDLQNAFNALKAALDRQREFTRSDVEELLKRFIGDTAIGLFEGRVEALTDALLSHAAEPGRIQQFYAGAPLDWDVIAAHGDIERDQQLGLIQQLIKPFGSLRLVCIVAEPGAGKSTLAWRAAAELHRQHGAFVVRIRDKEDPDVWYHMADFCQRMRRPFFVLVDDLFRDPDIVSALRELSSLLPITVLATSRANEYRPHRLKGELVRVLLKGPSPDERERILQRLEKTPTDLTPEQRLRLDAANQFLVLMMELTAGKGLQEIIRDTLERLWMIDESAYRAYEYLSFAYKHSISMPSSLLERLDGQGRFHNLPGRETAKGLIFSDEDRKGNVRVGHPVIAETAYSFYESHRAPANVLQEIVCGVDMPNYLERRFVAHLLRVLAQVQSPSLHAALPQIEAAITRCQERATLGELCIWRTFYRRLEQHAQADRCMDAALKLVPISPGECNMLFHLHRERGRERDALPVLAEWVRKHADLHGARPAYLVLVERYGTDEERDAAINETGAWLAKHPEDTYVRAAYLGLVERQREPKERDAAINETGAWLAKHPEDTNVRVAYLGLVERQGEPEQVEQVLKETSTWVESHPNATDVWSHLISSLVKLQKLDDAAIFAKKAIFTHSRNANLVMHYLRLTQEQLDEQRVREFYAALMKTYSAGNPIKNAYGRWLHSRGYLDEAENILKSLVENSPRDFGAKHSYARLLLDMTRYSEAADQLRKALRIHKGFQMAHDGLAQALRGLASQAEEGGKPMDAEAFLNEAEREFQQAIYWAGVQGKPQAIFYAHLGWFYIDRERWWDALEAFKQAVHEAPDFFANYWGQGRALIGLGQFQEAANILHIALEKAPDDFQPPASQEIPELLRQCQTGHGNG